MKKNRAERRASKSKKPRAKKLRSAKAELAVLVDQQRQNRKVHLPLIASQAHRRLDAAVLEEKPEHATCTKGCAACCRQLILVTQSEALLILARHPEAVEEARTALEQRVEMGEVVFPHKIFDPISAPEKVLEMTQRWWEQQVDCPFLDADQSCSIYDVRPLVCRKHYAVSPPTECSPMTSFNGPLVWEPNAFQEIKGEVFEAEQALQGQIMLGPLPNLVLACEKSLKTLEGLEGS